MDLQAVITTLSPVIAIIVGIWHVETRIDRRIRELSYSKEEGIRLEVKLDEMSRLLREIHEDLKQGSRGGTTA